jgi:hypothetical protein
MSSLLVIYENCNEISSSIIGEEFIDYLSDC